LRHFVRTCGTVAVLLAVAACGSSNSSSTSSSSAATTAPPSSTSTATSTSSPTSTDAATGAGVKISSATIPRLGPVLVNAQGRTLYMFEPDKDKRVTCVTGCAAVWPPLFLPSGQKPVAVGAVKEALLGSDADPTGGQVITYNGWPLYTYVADTAPGKATGQAINLNGGLWYVLSTAGKVITTKP